MGDLTRILTATAVVVSSLSSATLAAQRVEHSLDGAWEVRRADAKTAPWRPIRVPSTFETALGTGFDGVAEYRRTVTVAELAGLRGDPRAGLRGDDRVGLRFAAVATHATVFVDDVEVGRHLGGWTPFRCAIPARLFDREAWTIRVRVDERVGHNTQGFLPVIAPHFGGIWQGVRLCVHRGATLEPDDVVVRTDWRDGRAVLHVDAGPLAAGTRLRCTLTDGAPQVLPPSLLLPPTIRPWSPREPNRYGLRIELLDADGHVDDQVERTVVFVNVRAEGRKILVNGESFRPRGVLHWGYEPPSLAPHLDVERWRQQLRYLRSLGFNLVKACLWFPPPEFFAAAEEVGLFVWQEYPTWHANFAEQHAADLTREYDEFFAIDRQRPVILARSLTCETGQGQTDPGLIERLFKRCKTVTGAALVEDDSSWITWNRYHDFYDDHPYGNCGPWLGELRRLDEYIRKTGPKPFLLGEAIAADTWLAPAVFADAGLQKGWWLPLALERQRAFAAEVRRDLGGPAAAALHADSMRYAMRARKYQMETFTRVFPHAGYVVSVMRDFRKARMGLVDDLGRPKWTAQDFAWHGERMTLLDDPRAIRSVRHSLRASPPTLFGAPRVAWRIESARFVDGRWQLETGGGAATPDGVGTGLRRFLLRAAAVGPNARPNEWMFYQCPEVSAAVPAGVRIASTLDAETLEWVGDGGRLLLTAGGKGALRSDALWFLRGAPYGPIDHALLRRVPREFLVDLQPFDFDGPVFVETPLTAKMPKILGFWDTHDRVDDVGRYTLLAEARLGRGRILACALNLDLAPEPPFATGTGADTNAGVGAGAGAAATAPNPARAWLRAELLRHLAHGEAPRAAFGPANIAQFRRQLTARRVGLEGVWRLQADADDVGTRQHWEAIDFDDAGWLKARAGTHWENVGLPHYDGVAWYRKRFTAPSFWVKGEPLYAVFDGVDDSYTLFVNGKRVASFGDPKTEETVWLTRTRADISAWLRPGQNMLALRVVDHRGAGGLHRSVRLSTADPKLADIVNR